MRVLKFGGTSIGSVNSILSVKKAVETTEKPVIAAVSTLGGITDKLLATSTTTSKGDLTYEKKLSEIIAHHLDVIEGVIEDKEVRMDVQKKVMALLDELSSVFKSAYLANDLPAKTSSAIVNYGRHLSSLIVPNAIKDAKLFDSHKYIKTVKQFNKHIMSFDLTGKFVKETFSPLSKVFLVPGFISSSTETGEATNLGRGGSDYTAPILATILDASISEVWTDVDGSTTAGPRVISSAYVIDWFTSMGAAELHNFGAKVIYPSTVYPVYYKSILIRILNIFNLAAPGTYISKERVKEKGKVIIRSISSINDTRLIAVQGLGMVDVIDMNYQIFKTLAKNGISVLMVSQASFGNNTTFAVCNVDADLAIQVLNNEFTLRRVQGNVSDTVAEEDLATTATVGENMKRTPGIVGRLFGVLGRTDISVVTCTQGTSETNISFVIEYRHLHRVLNFIHGPFFLSEYRVLNPFTTGVGAIGGNLLEQIRIQQPKLTRQNGLKLNIVGVSNSKKAFLCRGGINLNNYLEELRENGEESNPEHPCEEAVKMNTFNSVPMDYTASPDVTVLYKTLMNNNVSVAAANKEAASSSYDNYTKLKEAACHRSIESLFGTNVDVSLPIINTMSDLINSGGHILKLEAVLPSTLNYILSAISTDIPFSETTHVVKEAGYVEPGLRIDLNGGDVIRKLVILAREAGYPVEQADIKRSPLIPEGYFEGSLEDFWKSIKDTDAGFGEKRQLLETGGRRFRFVAKMENGACEVGPQAIDSHHPSYRLEGSDNIIMISTERYHEYPMIIKGYGARASVTAVGVLADIISIANTR